MAISYYVMDLIVQRLDVKLTSTEISPIRGVSQIVGAVIALSIIDSECHTLIIFYINT